MRVALVCIAVVPLIVASSAIMLITNDRMSAFETAAYTQAGPISSEALPTYLLTHLCTHLPTYYT